MLTPNIALSSIRSPAEAERMREGVVKYLAVPLGSEKS